MKWNKSEVNREEVHNIVTRWRVNPIIASILLRRGLTDAKQMWPFMEGNTRYLHNPFLLEGMEDAVDRVMDAVEDSEETQPKVLVYGDRDVDGITATAIMKGALEAAGCAVTCRVPVGDEPYGLKAEDVDEAAAEGISLIVTVDCGISSNEAVSRARDCGIDVIITDHHNPPDVIPDATVILDPKTEGSGYPFKGLSGAGVALKVSYALQFAKSAYYQKDITFLDAQVADGCVNIECIKTRNLVITDRMQETIRCRMSVMDSRLVKFLAGQSIFVWDAPNILHIMEAVFGHGIEMQVTDVRDAVSKTWKQFLNVPLDDMRAASRISSYRGEGHTVDVLYNIFVTWVHSSISAVYEAEMGDVCLAALSTMADIMPMVDENKIIIKTALRTIRNGKVRHGLSEIMAQQAIMPQNVTEKDLSWRVIPALNACGRMGQSDLALTLLTSADADERERLAADIVALNEERKRLVSGALSFVGHKAKESLENSGGKIITVIDGRIAKGITGLVASRLAEQYGVPVIIGAKADNKITGSMRAHSPFSCTEFLSRIDGFSIDYGGHNSAAGFSFMADNESAFCCKVSELSSDMEIQEGNDTITIDAEIPPDYVKSLWGVVDFFAPYGAENGELLFLTRSVSVSNAIVVGKSAKPHLKLTLDMGDAKMPAMLWGGGDMLDKEITIGDVINVIYTLENSTFNGMPRAQMIIKDWEQA